jgi:hypothetical protein
VLGLGLDLARPASRDGRYKFNIGLGVAVGSGAGPPEGGRYKFKYRFKGKFIGKELRRARHHGGGSCLIEVLSGFGLHL